MVFVYVPTGITFSFLHPSCASMLWIEWFSFLFFSCCFWWSYNNIVAGICQYIFVFLCYYFLFICFVMCLYFIICLYFLLFSVNLYYCEVVKVGYMSRTDGREGREGRVRLRRSSASKAAGILLKPLKKSQNSLTLKQLGFFQQRSLPAA